MYTQMKKNNVVLMMMSYWFAFTKLNQNTNSKMFVVLYTTKAQNSILIKCECIVAAAKLIQRYIVYSISILELNLKNIVYL